MENLHPNNANANDSIDVMRKKTCFDSSEKLERIGFGKVSQPLVQALYKVAYNVAKQKKPTTAENLIILCALEMVEFAPGKEILLSNSIEDKIEILLSNNIISKRFNDMSVHVLDQIIQEIFKK